ncbi:MAG: hypothetical protein PWP72_402 [Thermoanaerobacter sp.]|nr:hypothetical protein [Thermoanaerobacter sp.]
MGNNDYCVGSIEHYTSKKIQASHPRRQPAFMRMGHVAFCSIGQRATHSRSPVWRLAIQLRNTRSKAAPMGKFCYSWV